MSFLGKKENNILVLDFGSKELKGFIFEKAQDKNIIKKFRREELSRYGVFNGRDKIVDTRDIKEQDFEFEIVKGAVVRLLKNLGLGKEVSRMRVFMGLPADFLKTRIFDISFTREKWQKKITEKEEKLIYSQISKAIQDKISNHDPKKPGLNIENPRTVRVRVVCVKISGYKVSSLVGLKGENLNFKVVVIFCQREYFDFLKTVAMAFNLNKFQVIHEVEGLIDGLKNKDKSNHLFVDIGRKNTQVFFFKDELEWAFDFKAGDYDAVSALSEKLGITDKEAEVLKDNFSLGKLSEKTSQKVEVIVSPVISKWIEMFKVSLKNIALTCPKVIIFGEGGSLKGLIETIKNCSDVSVLEVNELKIADVALENPNNERIFDKDIATLLLSYGFFTDKK